MTPSDLPTTPLFDPKLFWEICNIDYHAQPMTTIFKVIRYGSIQDISQLKSIYTRTDIQKFMSVRWQELHTAEKRLLSVYYAL